MNYLRSERGKWAFALALFSICLQIFLPLGLAAATSQASDDVFSNRIVICTAFGLKQIDLVTGQEVPLQDGGMVDCPVCLAYAIGDTALAPPAQTSALLQRSFTKNNVPMVYTVFHGIEITSDYLTRAPPVAI